MPPAISFHSYKDYKECPLRYILKKQKVKPPKPKDEYNTIYGSVVQKAFEHFFNDELWKRGKLARQIMKDNLIEQFNAVVRTKYVEWGNHDGGREGLYQECLNSIEPNIDVVKSQNLLGEYAKSEVPVYAKLTEYSDIMGRIDFIIRRSGKVLIFDGKGSKQREKYLDKDQLYWYALVYFLHYKKLPDSLWYWFYRYPEDPLLQVEFDVPTLKDLKDEVVEALTNIHKRKFIASPSSKVCYYCPYSGSCKYQNNYKNKTVVEDKSGAIIELGLD